MPAYVVVWVLLIFAWAANFVIRIGFSALLPSIIDELQLSYTRAGLLASAFFYAYALMQLPSASWVIASGGGASWCSAVSAARSRPGSRAWPARSSRSSSRGR
jgi:hypothetical protein